MTQPQVEAKLTANLKKYLKSEGHVESGKLLKSLKIEGSAAGFKVVGLEYVQYLDDGEFLNNFFSLPSTNKLIEEYIAITVNKEIEGLDLSNL